jgi:hypothetical protein
VLLLATCVGRIITVGTDNVLAEATLSDGTILRLDAVTSGSKQKLILEHRSSKVLTLLNLQQYRPEVSASAEFGEMSPRCTVWLTRRDPNTGDPLDLDWLSHCTAIDADGWESTSGSAGRCHWATTSPTNPYEDSLSRDRAPFSALPPGKYRQIVVGAFLPLFRPKDGRFPLKVYNKQGEVVATFDATYPTPPPTRADWTPVKLPATQTTGDLSVTLERVEWTPQPSDPSVPENRLPTWKLSPSTTLTWHGEPSDNWRLITENILAVEDGLGNMSYMDKCRLTPHVPAWKVGFLLWRKPEGRYEPHEEWDPGPIEMPAAGESRALTLSGEIDGVPVRLLRVCAPGKHQFTVTIPASRAVLGNAPPYSKEGAGWKTTVDHRPGFADWTVETNQPAFVWQLDWGTPGRKIPFSRVFDTRDTQMEVDEFTDYGYEQVTHLAFLKLSPSSDSIVLKPTIYETRTVYFQIEPPRGELANNE